MNQRYRYSEIVGSAFYQIYVPQQHREMLDVFFTAAAHHFQLIKIAYTDADRDFHILRFRAHLCEMKAIIYMFGDFSRAVDRSLRGLHRREGWNPARDGSLPDPDMFDSMTPDSTCGVGQAHPCDIYLKSEILTDVPVVIGRHGLLITKRYVRAC